MIETTNYTGAFANWWAATFDGIPCPPLPKKPDDLGITQRLAMAETNPVLFQNLFGNSGLGSSTMPADTVTRRANGQLEPRDIPHLRAAGLEWEAQQLEQLAQRQQDQRLVDATRASAAAAQQELQQSAVWNNASFMERLALSGGPSPQAVAQARRMWGITGE
jgi:hypothetical protein